MLFVHGHSEPLRIAEEIRFWKMQERDNAAILRSMVPWGPEHEVLAAWERALSAAEASAHGWLTASIGGLRAGSHSSLEAAARAHELEALIAEAAAQSQQWVALLLDLSKTVPPAAHMARESEYFLETLNNAGALRGSGYRSAASSTNAAAPEEPRPTILAEGTWSSPMSAPNEPVPIGGHTLPPLPYAYDALEPHLDAESVRIHHSILHKNYVEGLNTAEKELAEARQTGSFDLVKHWERELAFNGAGHYLHTVYFFGMSPEGGGRPSGELAAQITNDFGSYDAFHRHFSSAAEKVEGSGWAHLVWSPRSQRLQILQAEKHQNLTQWDDIPLLSIDVWEHSYYLKYKNERANYIEAWFEVVNWPYAAERYHAARALKWKPY